MMDDQGNFTGKYGIRGEDDFIDNPAAQAAAFKDYARKNENYTLHFGLDDFIGRMIKIVDKSDKVADTFVVTRGSLLAAMHRGIRNVLDYFSDLQEHSRPAEGESSEEREEKGCCGLVARRSRRKATS